MKKFKHIRKSMPFLQNIIKYSCRAAINLEGGASLKLLSAGKSLWCVFAILLVITISASVFFVQRYQNEHKTTVEPIRFSGTYQLEDGAPPQPLTDSTYMDACEYSSVTLRGTFDRTLEKGMQLFFFMEYLEAHIYLDGKEIYTWGTAETHPFFLRSAGAAWGHCALPAAVLPGDEITILLESKYSNNYNSAYHDFLDSLQTGDSGALAQELLKENCHHLLTSVLLFLIGITLLLFSLLLSKQGIPIHPSVYYCSFFVLSCSLWTVLNPMYSVSASDKM